MSTSKILLVEDDTNVASYIKFRLKRNGFEVRHEDNGLDGVEAIQDWQPDLVILDMMMPGIDGREVTEIVNEKKLMNPGRIIILSGKDVTEEIKALFELGVEDYLKKPFNIDELMIRIERALSKQKMHKN